ncbi:MAG TPA: phosphate ABC transporter permease subunit PstC [Tepidisphaeraceae bacterium]|jgi:phosphate transport system permease protein|nr:phosphate ABC transporter permease subunit PstC [Tepidisphaeraceae bacterium]
MTAVAEPISSLSSPTAISRPPSGFDRLIDRATRLAAWSFGCGTIFLLAFIIYEIGLAAMPALRDNKLSVLLGNTWDSNRNLFGLRAPILGTIYSSLIALVIASIFGIAIAVFLSQKFLPRKLEILFKNIVELLAAIPSVVYGLWGIYVVIPFVRPILNDLSATVGKWFPLLSGHLSGPGMFPAALVLAIMVLPTISAISYDALLSVNPRIKEAALGLGATRWEAILRVIIPTASTGIFGSVILGFGRALGETMALAMLLGNVNVFSVSLLSPGNTLAALIANNYGEAFGSPEMPVLLLAGMILMAITLLINIIGALVIQAANRRIQGVHK